MALEKVQLLQPQQLVSAQFPQGFSTKHVLPANPHRNVVHEFMNQFPRNDEWSKQMCSAIDALADSGHFHGRDILGLGIGDGRNERRARHRTRFYGGSVEKIIGVDIETEKLRLAYENLVRDSDNRDVELYLADAVAFLEHWEAHNSLPFSGTAFICLPQALDGDKGTTADIIPMHPSHAPFIPQWGKFALHLNAGILTRLATISDQADALVILSGRIPESLHQGLFDATGWRNERVIAQARVWQDQDTPLSWMRALAEDYDDGHRFFDKHDEPISMLQAIQMHEQGERIRHDVLVYQLKV